MRLVTAILVILSALLLNAAVRVDVPTPSQWTKAELVGFVKGPDDLQLFGAGRKELDIVLTKNRWSYHYGLVFACEADYRACEALINQAVVMQAYEVRDADHRYYLYRSALPFRTISDDERPEADPIDDAAEKVDNDPETERWIKLHIPNNPVAPGDVIIPAGD